MKKPLIIITGPTAVGKTAVSVELAKRINGEIISADSMQVYKRMDIGTAKITPSETDGIRHHLIDILEPDEDFNVYLFKNLAKKAIDDIYSRGNIPIIAGGTGFYIQSVLYEIDFSENEDTTSYRKSLYELAKSRGPEYVHDMLRQVDPKSAENIHFNNVKRVVRALEFYKQTGSRISVHNEVQKNNESPYNFLYIVLNDEREKLYERINRRVDSMFADGLFNEVNTLVEGGLTRDMNSMKAIGYREFFDYFDKNATLDEVREKIKSDTRHFAKRQLTWFRREKSVTMININEFNYDKDAILSHIMNLIRKKGITDE